MINHAFFFGMRMCLHACNQTLIESVPNLQKIHWALHVCGRLLQTPSIPQNVLQGYSEVEPQCHVHLLFAILAPTRSDCWWWCPDALDVLSPLPRGWEVHPQRGGNYLGRAYLTRCGVLWMLPVGVGVRRQETSRSFSVESLRVGERLS